MATLMQPPQGKPHNPDLPYYACEPTGADFYGKAPVRYVTTVDLPVPPDKLFEVFEDPQAWPKWAHGIGKVVWTSPQPYDVGTTRTVIFWGGMEVYEDFVAWDAGKEMAFVFYGTTQDVWDRFGEHYAVTPTADGCRLVWTVAMEPAGVLKKLQPLVGWIFALNFKSYMWRLKRYCRRVA
jgi:hypothetical protein